MTLSTRTPKASLSFASVCLVAGISAAAWIAHEPEINWIARPLASAFSREEVTRGEQLATWRMRPACAAARRAAARQRLAGQTADILFQAGDGMWHREHVEAGERPDVDVAED